jgi:hypothetical protein
VLQYVHANNDRLLRGLVWVLVEDDIERLSMFAVAASATDPRSTGYPYAPAAAATAVLRLGRAAGDVAVRTLARLSLTVKNKTLNGRVRAALSELGALRGWSPSEVLELAVDDHGLTADGTLIRPVDDCLATVGIDDGKARLSFSRGDKALKAVPAAVKERHGDELTALKKLVKDLDATLARERARVEGLLSEEREWPYTDWVARMLAHPVTGTFGRRLIFETTVDGSLWTAGLPVVREGGWALETLEDVIVRGDRVRLWHPIRAGADVVTAWRDHVAATGLRQPFRQAFREVYLLTPAEEQTEVYSNRFAAHILRYRQANALMRVRGWSANYLGGWDGGYASTATKVLGGGSWRANFDHELVAENDQFRAELCSTDQVRFDRRDGAVWEPVRVPDVPPVVLSEAMRDVDLFVGVTSVAADPEWIDRRTGHTEYWRSAAFGALTASAEVRRDALARLLPRTKIARQVELEGNYLRVRGSLRAYRIHLGSGNILMEPNNVYLCIVAGREKSARLSLPFEDDAMLSMILSKAFLLAADVKITDESILRQIQHG